MLGEELPNIGALCFRTIQTIEVGAKLLGARQGCEIPAHMLARNAHAHHIPIESVKCGQML